jgi:tetratricopeptide (TPR) repeat protein
MNLSTMHSKAGHHDEAMVWIEQAIAIHRAKFGPRSTQVGMSLRNKGRHHLRAKRWKEARAVFLEAIDAIEGAEGPTTPLLAKSLDGLGDAEMELGHRDAAIAAWERALSVLGDDPGFRKGIEDDLAKARAAK